MSSANAFSLFMSKILSFGKGLMANHVDNPNAYRRRDLKLEDSIVQTVVIKRQMLTKRFLLTIASF